MLVFSDGSERPEYVPWTDVRRVEFDHSAGRAEQNGNG